MEEGDIIIDIESCHEAESMSTHKLPGCENPSEKNSKRERRFLVSAKKPPKPPRPPRGLSLDAADQKLIREISELAVIKRARIERLKKLKGAKGSAAGGNLIAMVFTLLFCVLFIFEGCHPLQIFPSKSSAIGFSSSPTRIGDNHIVGVKDQRKSSSGSVHGSSSSSDESLSFMELAPVLGNNKEEAKKQYVMSKTHPRALKSYLYSM